MSIQSGEEEEVPLGDHANLLSLLQDLTEGLLAAVEHNEDRLAQVDLLQHLQRQGKDLHSVLKLSKVASISKRRV